jgi:hypothetical protein
LTLADLHPHTLTLRQPAQPTALERCRMDEDILPTAIRPYEPKSFFGVVKFDRTDAFLGRSDGGLSLSVGSRARAPLNRTRYVNCTCIHLDQFGDLGALLAVTTSNLEARPLRHAVMSRCLQLADM